MKKSLLIALLAGLCSIVSFNAFAARSDKSLINECRSYIVKSLKNPNSFERLDFSVTRNFNVPRGNGTNYVGDVAAIDFIATNSYGTRVKQTTVCVFNSAGMMVDYSVSSIKWTENWLEELEGARKR